MKKITIDDQGLHLTTFKFTWLDNNFMLNGYIRSDFRNFLIMRYTVKRREFFGFNLDKKSNPDFYGKLFASTKRPFDGSYRNPEISMTFDVEMNRYYLMCNARWRNRLVSHQGIAEFIDPLKADSIVVDALTSYLKWHRTIKNFRNQNFGGCVCKTTVSLPSLSTRTPGILYKSADRVFFKIFLDQSDNPGSKRNIRNFDGSYGVCFTGRKRFYFYERQQNFLEWKLKWSIPWSFLQPYSIRTSSSVLVSNEIYGHRMKKKAYQKPLPYTVKLLIFWVRFKKPEIVDFNRSCLEEDKMRFRWWWLPN